MNLEMESLGKMGRLAVACPFSIRKSRNLPRVCDE